MLFPTKSALETSKSNSIVSMDIGDALVFNVEIDNTFIKLISKLALLSVDR